MQVRSRNVARRATDGQDERNRQEEIGAMELRTLQHGGATGLMILGVARLPATPRQRNGLETRAMNQRRDARLAGIAFPFYIVMAMTSTTMFDGVLGPGGITQQLGDVTRMMGQARVTIVLDLPQVVCALVLAVTLFRLTKVVDETVAMLAMTFAVGEGVLGAASISPICCYVVASFFQRSLGPVW